MKNPFISSILILAITLFAGCSAKLRDAVFLDNAEKKRLTFTISENITVGDGTFKFVLEVPVPSDIDYRQKIIKATYNPKPDSIYEKDGNYYAEFFIINPDPVMTITMTYDMEISRFDLETAMSGSFVAVRDGINPRKYLNDEKNIESDNSDIRKIASEIQGNDEVETVQAIYRYVGSRLDYDFTKKTAWKGAAASLKNRSGVCSDYSDLFIALCRAKGIPARYVSGFAMREGVTKEGHAWVDVFFTKFGWIPFDATWGDSKRSEATEKYLPNSYLTMSTERNRFDAKYTYWGGSMDINTRYEISGIVEESSLDTRLAQKPFREFLAQEAVKSDLLRLTDYFHRVIDDIEVPDEQKAVMKKQISLSFKNKSLDESEIKQILSGNTELANFIKGKAMSDYYTIKRIMRIARLRTSFEKDEHLNKNGENK